MVMRVIPRWQATHLNSPKVLGFCKHKPFRDCSCSREALTRKSPLRFLQQRARTCTSLLASVQSSLKWGWLPLIECFAYHKISENVMDTSYGYHGSISIYPQGSLCPTPGEEDQQQHPFPGGFVGAVLEDALQDPTGKFIGCGSAVSSVVRRSCPNFLCSKIFSATFQQKTWKQLRATVSNLRCEIQGDKIWIKIGILKLQKLFLSVNWSISYHTRSRDISETSYSYK